MKNYAVACTFECQAHGQYTVMGIRDEFREGVIEFSNSDDLCPECRAVTPLINTEGEESKPPFRFLVHVDLRRYNIHYLAKVKDGGFIDQHDEEAFLTCCGGGSTLPQRVAGQHGYSSADPVPWAANVWLDPWELTKEVVMAAVAITVDHPGGRIALL